MPKRKVFYSFHYENDVMRVQQVRNIGVLEGNPPTTPNSWEQIKRNEAGIKKWINDNMQNKSCLIVLVGSDTANRKWVNYEIIEAWKKGIGVVGVYIHNLNCPRTGRCRQGTNPFSKLTFGDGNFDQIVKCYNPSSYDTYNYISNNIDGWIEEAIQIRNRYK